MPEDINSSTSSQPPPLPAESKPIKRAEFKESVRFSAATFDYRLIEKSHLQAEAWINANPSIEVVQIQTFHSSTYGITVVWYR